MNDTDGTIMVAADYSSIEAKAWWDHFDLSNGVLIGDGELNTA